MKKPKQKTLPGVLKETPLSKACDEFVGILDQFDGLKNAKELVADKILIEMDKNGQLDMCIDHNGIGYRFSITRGKKKLVVKKVKEKKTKTRS